MAGQFLLPTECSIDTALQRGFNDLLQLLSLKLFTGNRYS